ncbi:hypothetical protein P4519_00750, partial [Geobacillus stearothermophilus]|uniref:hypothetical protein n=1 Tax=Geobacillus stearothermophilus TaxID=1422 RepID=UPI002E1E4200|nr:hypothetical protein [Geobacillus stearothermophilus]
GRYCLTPLHHTKRAFFDQVPGKAPNGNAPFKKKATTLILQDIPSGVNYHLSIPLYKITYA